jgi:hypothetical protein
VELRPAVNGLALPDLLVRLIRAGCWTHPGEARLRKVIPFLVDPVDFLTSPEAMARESSGRLADDPKMAAVFHLLRSSRMDGPIELPWLDADRSFFVAVNHWPGDDVGIALDYRASVDNPCVVAGDWGSGRGCVWREVAPTFSGFVRLLGLGSPDAEPDVAPDCGGTT